MTAYCTVHLYTIRSRLLTFPVYLRWPLQRYLVPLQLNAFPKTPQLPLLTRPDPICLSLLVRSLFSTTYSTWKPPTYFRTFLVDHQHTDAQSSNRLMWSVSIQTTSRTCKKTLDNSLPVRKRMQAEKQWSFLNPDPSILRSHQTKEPWIPQGYTAKKMDVLEVWPWHFCHPGQPWSCSHRQAPILVECRWMEGLGIPTGLLRVGASPGGYFLLSCRRHRMVPRYLFPGISSRDAPCISPWICYEIAISPDRTVRLKCQRVGYEIPRYAQISPDWKKLPC